MGTRKRCIIWGSRGKSCQERVEWVLGENEKGEEYMRKIDEDKERKRNRINKGRKGEKK